MRENYKLQNTNYKQIPNYKFQITNKAAPFGQVLNAFGERHAHELHELTRIAGGKYTGKITTKGSHGLHQGSFKLQTMTALMKSFCGGSRGAVFSKRAPLVQKKVKYG